MDMPPGVLPPEDRKLLEQGDDLHAVTNARAYFKTHGAAVWQRRQSRTLKRILRDGLPDEYRGEAWLTLSGARSAMLAAGPGYYWRLVRSGEAGEAGGCEHEAQIDKDVTRCVPAPWSGPTPRHFSCLLPLCGREAPGSRAWEPSS